MRYYIIRGLLLLLLVLTLVDCAKRGTPTGGEKDIEPPVLVKATPELNKTNFNVREIKLTFDEYVKLDKLQQQLIVSPPMQYDPEISPSGSASKVITIKITDTLDENTTYVINFGQSIKDNNEGNAYNFFRYIFSTGDYIDSLNVKGYIRDAFEKEADDYVTVMLYKVDTAYSDSLIFKQKPTYVTNTLDSTTAFEITNVKPGKYKLYALKDSGNNYMFNQKTDKIAFREETITIPTDTTYTLNLFKEINNYRATNPSLAAKNRIIFGFEGDTTNVNIDLISEKPDDFAYRILPDKQKDTLHYWFTPFETDSLLFKVTKNEVIDTFTVRIKELYYDSLTIKPNYTAALPPNKIFKIGANAPLASVNNDSISIIDQDSAAVSFTTKLLPETNEVAFDFEMKEEARFKINLLPGAIKDMYHKTNDSVNYSLARKKLSDYGTIIVKLRGAESYPVLVQLTDSKGIVKEERYAKNENETNFYFTSIDPGTYLLRVIYDTNDNQRWDTGNYLQKIQPEQIYYYPDPIELRANWDFEQLFILNE